MLDRDDSAAGKPDDPPPDLATLRARVAQIVAGTHSGTGGPGGSGIGPLRVLPPLTLARGRVHQATGPARRVLAAMAAGAAQTAGPVLWFRPRWQRARLYPAGLNRFADPGALIQVACPNGAGMLGALEETLRSGAVALAVAELPVMPDLRQLRRLHLAAAEGVASARAAGHDRRAPLGLVFDLERSEAALAGVESRWRLAPLPPDPLPDLSPIGPRMWRGEALPSWRLDLLRARDTPPGAWRIDWTPEGAVSIPLGLSEA